MRGRPPCAVQLECERRASRPCRDFDLPGLGWSGRGGVGIRVACFVTTCLDMAWSGRGGDGIRVACFVGPAVQISNLRILTPGFPWKP